MTIGKRIKLGRENIGLSQAKFAEEIGASQSAMWSWESDRTAPNRKYIAEIAKLIGISVTQLEFGNEQDTHLREPSESFEIEERKTINVYDQEENDTIYIPEYNIRLSAGGGAVVEEENIKDKWAFNKSYLEELRLQSASLIIAEIDGDSMEPKLVTGDRVMINKNDTDPNRPGIFAIWDSTALVVKRIEKVMGSDPVMLRLISDNKNHSHYDVFAQETRIIGRVVWFARRM